jgi:hypothetical protein
MSETVSLDALGVRLRRMQVDVSAISVKLDLLTRGRERDLTALATRDDLRDILPPCSLTNWRTSIWDQRRGGAACRADDVDPEDAERHPGQAGVTRADPGTTNYSTPAPVRGRVGRLPMSQTVHGPGCN